jgi:hypothetical protein
MGLCMSTGYTSDTGFNSRSVIPSSFEIVSSSPRDSEVQFSLTPQDIERLRAEESANRLAVLSQNSGGHVDAVDVRRVTSDSVANFSENAASLSTASTASAVNILGTGESVATVNSGDLPMEKGAFRVGGGRTDRHVTSYNPREVVVGDPIAEPKTTTSDSVVLTLDPNTVFPLDRNAENK